MNANEMYDFLRANEICTPDFLSGALAIGGFNTETLECVLYYHTGYRNFGQYIECEYLGEEEE